MDRCAHVVVCGPTATGKSELAQRIAEKMGGVVLSADSMQVYRGMDIGTAKIAPSERRVAHFGLDLTDPDRPYSTALYQRYGRQVMEDAEDAGHSVVMAGGTGLYIRAVIDDLRFPEGEQEDNPVRERYMRMAAEQGSEEVWKALRNLDPKSADTIHPHNLKRVVRALEMHHAGESYAERAHGLAQVDQLIDAVHIGLAAERSTLYERIDARVDAMRANGLIEEVEHLARGGFSDSLTARQAIGYKEVLDALAGRCTMDEAFESIKRSSRRYAKRQMTWFSRDARIHWIDVTDADLDRAAEEAFGYMGTR